MRFSVTTGALKEISPTGRRARFFAKYRPIARRAIGVADIGRVILVGANALSASGRDCGLPAGRAFWRAGGIPMCATGACEERGDGDLQAARNVRKWHVRDDPVALSAIMTPGDEAALARRSAWQHLTRTCWR